MGSFFRYSVKCVVFLGTYFSFSEIYQTYFYIIFEPKADVSYIIGKMAVGKLLAAVILLTSTIIRILSIILP